MRFSKLFSFIAVVLLVTVLFASVVSISAIDQTDSMQYRYDGGHTGDYRPVAGNVLFNPKLKWQVTVCDNYDGPYGSLAVVDGVLYIGGYRLYAFNMTTGVEFGIMQLHSIHSRTPQSLLKLFM